MIREGQPIKCMDATILGIHLTTGIQGVYTRYLKYVIFTHMGLVKFNPKMKPCKIIPDDLF